MGEYILRLVIMVPLIGAMAWGSLWLWRKAQLSGAGLAGLAFPKQADRKARVLDVLSVGSGTKIAVIDFGDKELLVAISRAQTRLLSEREKGDFHA